MKVFIFLLLLFSFDIYSETKTQTETKTKTKTKTKTQKTDQTLSLNDDSSESVEVELKKTDGLTFESLLASVEKHHPVILKELEKLNESIAAINQREGAFDLNLSAKSSERTTGKYDGEQFRVSLEKPIPYFNADLFTQYRRGQGSFPVYEDEYLTLEDGEVAVGLRFSLLRYREIDTERLMLQNAKIEKSIVTNHVDIIKEQLRYYVLKTYIGWIYSRKEVGIYQVLLDYSLKQDEAIRFRVKKGDLSEIYITENTQYILRRKNQLEKAKQKFNMMQYYVSLLWRDKEGKILTPVVPSDENVYEKIYAENIIEQNINLDDVLPVQILKLKIDKTSNKILDANNKLLPKFDVELLSSKDNGPTNSGLDEPEQKILLSFEIPIERNLGRGSVNRYKAQKKQLEYKLRYYQDKLLSKGNMVRSNLKSIKQQVVNYQNELTVAEKMQEAEKIKFKNGGSDFFLVNLREQKFAKAQISYLKSKYSYVSLYCQYKLLKRGILKEFKL